MPFVSLIVSGQLLIDVMRYSHVNDNETIHLDLYIHLTMATSQQIFTYPTAFFVINSDAYV